MGVSVIVEQTKSQQGLGSLQIKGTKEKRGFLPWFKKDLEVKIANYIDMNLVFFLNVDTSSEAIDCLVDGLYEFEVIPDKNIFSKAIFEREKIVSTGIGMGVAIPHAKIYSLSDFFIAIGVQRGKGIEWNAIDKAPVRLIFMIGGPDNKQTEYLQILSHLTRIIKDESLRKKIISAKKPEEIVKLLSPF